MNSIVNWFEIPTANLDRAVRFYESMLGIRLKLATFNGVQQAMLLGDKDDASGSLIADPRRKRTLFQNAEKRLRTEKTFRRVTPA